MCSPSGDVEKPPVVKVDVKPEFSVTVKREATPSAPPPAPTVVGRNPIVQIPVQRPTAAPIPSPITKPATPALAPPPAPAAQQIRVPPPIQSTPLPQPRSLDQQADLSYNRFLCRTGEVVWFFRPKSSAWGLGLVVRRWAAKDNPTNRSYIIQPLSHPYESPAQELVTTDDHVKPWLAWSAPDCTYAYLRQNPQLSYGQVDWARLDSGQLGEGIASVDASIMAAKAIDSTYTLFERLKTTSDATCELRHYNGVYLGAEKIWRGEAVRLRIGTTGSDLMVITDIIEQVFAPQPPKPSATRVLVFGDIYSYATLPAPDPSHPPTPPNSTNPNIPARMHHDMAWRNRTLLPSTRTLAYWKLIVGAHKLDISDLKGRWYETSLVFQDPFAKAVKDGEGGNGIWMNSRGDATGLGKNAGAKRDDRVEAFGAAVPKGTGLLEGLEVPQQQQQQQAHEGLDMGIQTPAQQGQEAFSLDDFMNVDHLGEETGMQFGDAFTF